MSEVWAILIGLVLGSAVLGGPILFRWIAQRGSLTYGYQSRWFVRHEEGKVTIANFPDNQKVRTQLRVYEAPMGDYLKAYVQHVSRPRWRRRYDWSAIEESMRSNLNVLNLRWRE